MSSVALRNTAVAMALVALLLGANALRLASRSDAPTNGGTTRPAVVSVVAVRAVEAGGTVAREDVSLEQVGVRPEDGFARVDAVIGRRAVRALAVGEPLRAAHFEAPSALVQTLEPGERAIAVKVDGVVALGGFIQPGDRVDVLFYVASTAREVASTQARVLLEDVRVLAFGTETQAQSDAKPQPDARQAVLAVSRDDVATLMLGASAGRLRLALRANREPEPTARAPAVVSRLRDVVAEPGRPAAVARRGTVVYRGSQREEVRP